MLDDDTPTEGRSLSTRFHPRTLDELIEDPIPLTVTEPPGPANVSTLRPKARSLHAVLVESLNSTQALLRRLESGVTVPKDQQREIVRLLYVAIRHQVKALTACLELDGLE